MTTQFIIKSPRPNHQAVKVERVHVDGAATLVTVLAAGESCGGFVAGETYRITEAPLSEVPEKERTYTLAEKMAGVPFNPSNDPHVANCKEEFAACIARMIALRDAAHDSEVKRMASVAITEMQTAQMWAVKALTWRG